MSWVQKYDDYYSEEQQDFNVNSQCLNCIHFWNIRSESQKGKCTESNSPDYKKEVDYSNVCDYFEAI